jgi:DNA-binding response OmpR family regulator
MPTKIFLIEDDPTMLTLLQTYLQFEGFEVVLQNKDDDLQLVLEHLRQIQPEIILLDVYLDKLNGFDLLSAIRDEPDLQNIRVIMSSGIDFHDRCLKEGADGFILKPYMPDDLVKTIRRAITAE